ncbi:MAG TPA: PRC-barrel domain-containing protein [Desulfobacteria bacterium]|nr:PRC-barrel domain-containing protein [Desulfobacteria bacterium]
MSDVNGSVLKTQDIIGKPVISLQGEETGNVIRVVVDPAAKTVIGLTVSTKGLFKDEKGVLFSAIRSFGDYAVIVESSEAIMSIDNLPSIEKLTRENDIYNLRAVTPQGKLVGSVDDFYFNPDNGHIEKYILSGGLIRNLFKGKATIPSETVTMIGKDLLITIDSVESTIQKEESGLEGSLENIKGDLGHFREDFGQWTEDLDKAWDKTRNQVLQLSKVFGQNLKEAAKTGKGKGIEILSKTGEILNDKKRQLGTSYEWWIDRLQTAKDNSENQLPEHDINILVGLRSARAVLDKSGNIIVHENDVITRDHIDTCQKAGRTRELLISIATRDLEEKMMDIETETETQNESV